MDSLTQTQAISKTFLLPSRAQRVYFHFPLKCPVVTHLFTIIWFYFTLPISEIGTGQHFSGTWYLIDTLTHNSYTQSHNTVTAIWFLVPPNYTILDLPLYTPLDHWSLCFHTERKELKIISQFHLTHCLTTIQCTILCYHRK